MEPILANLAKDAGWICKIREDLKGDRNTQRYPSIWAFMAESPADLEGFMATDAQGDPSLQPWTDDFSNVFQILKWKSDEIP